MDSLKSTNHSDGSKNTENQDDKANKINEY